MSPTGAFEEEMTNDARNFLDAIARTIPEQPDPGLEADFVTRLAATARAEHVAGVTAPVRRTPRRFAIPRRFAMPVRIALASFGLVLSTAGLAVAGVRLPGPIDSGFGKVGIDLPHQEADDDGTPARPADSGDDVGSDGGSGSSNGGGGLGAKSQAVKQRGHGRKQSHPPGKGGGDENAGGNGMGKGNAGADPPTQAHEQGKSDVKEQKPSGATVPNAVQSPKSQSLPDRADEAPAKES